MNSFYRSRGVAPLLSLLALGSRSVVLILGVTVSLATLQAQSNYATPYTFTTFAGRSGNMSADGTGSSASFFYPIATAVDSGGNVYVADLHEHTIRKVTPSGVVSTFAGATGISGAIDGTGTAARFYNPQALAVDSTGNVYVADTSNRMVRKISPSGVVTTLAGAPGPMGSVDGTGGNARFGSPSGIAVDSSGNMYVTDGANNTIRKITSAGAVTTLAGLVGASGSADGTGTTARFLAPNCIAVNSAGTIFVGDGNQTIRKITSAGAVTTFAGSAGVWGSANGSGTSASFANISGVATDLSGNVYVSEVANKTVRKINSSGFVSTFAGATGISGYTDGTGANARFSSLEDISVDSAGNVYVADQGNWSIRKITSGGVVTTLAGALSGGSTDGTGTSARFGGPVGVTVDGGGNVYVADAGNNLIRKITSAGVVTTIAGGAGLAGSVDGTATVARFNNPTGVARDSLGNLYVADKDNSTIRKITPAGEVSTFAGLAGNSGSTDGTGGAARFSGPVAVTVDGADNVYVACFFDNRIRKISSGGIVTTIAVFNGSAPPYLFVQPTGLTADSAGNIYVADGIARILKISSAGSVSVVAGGFGGSVDSVGTSAGFTVPKGVAVDSAGNLYVADTFNHTIRKITSVGVVTTLGGVANMAGGADGTGGNARFVFPTGIAVDSTGAVYVTESDNRIRKGSLVAATPVFAVHPASQTVTAGYPATFSVVGFGYPLPTYQWQKNGVDISGATDVTYTAPNVSVGKPSLYTVIATNSAGSATSAGATLSVDPTSLTITTLAGSAQNTGVGDGVGSVARFNSPNGVAVDGAGNVFVADAVNRTIRRITPAGLVTTLAGSPGLNGTADGLGSTARFNRPGSLALDSGGNVYVTDSDNHSIRRITPAGNVTTFAGSPTGISGSTDGTGTAARLFYPSGLVVDSAGVLYVADRGNSTVRKIDPAGVVTTLAGTAGPSGFFDGVGSVARFNGPNGMAMDFLGNIYVAESGNRAIRRITPGGVVTTLAGSRYGISDGQGNAAGFLDPYGVAVDSFGNVYVSDSQGNTIRKITPSGFVTTVAGTPLFGGSADGTGAAVGFRGPAGLAIDSSDNIYIADAGNQTIRKGDLVLDAAPVVTAQTRWQKVFLGNNATFGVTANSVTGYQWQRSTDGGNTWAELSNGGSFAGVTTATLTVNGVDASMTGWRFRAVLSSNHGTTITEPSTLTAITDTPGLLWGYQSGSNGGQTLFTVSTPKAIGGGVLAVSAGRHSLFVKTDGTLWGMGSNYYGQLGNGTTGNTAQSTPAQITTNVTKVAAGGTHSLLVKTDGTLWATGNNYYGQLGDGTTTDRLSPTQTASNVSLVAAGNAHSFFIKTDGTLWAMGNNISGQLGDGSTTSRATPVQIATGVTSVATGNSHTLFIKTDGTLWAMGDNSYGKLGDGSTTRRNAPVQIATGVTSVAAGTDHTLFIKTDGTLWGMGGNNYGQLGDGTTISRSTPIQIGTGILGVSAGGYSTLILKTDHTLRAAGENYSGLSTTPQATPLQIASGILSMTVGSSHALILNNDGTLLAIGSNGDGQLGDRQVSASAPPFATGVVAMGVGLFVKSDGTLWDCVGADRVSQVAGVTGVIEAFVGAYREKRLYLKGDGTLWLLANDGTSSPVASGVVSAGAGMSYVTYLKSDGTLWGQGGDMWAIQFGNGTTPVQISDHVTSLSTSGWHLLYVKDDQTLWGMGNPWGGFNDSGVTTEFMSSPLLLETGVIAAFASLDQNLYIKSNGTLWTRGNGWSTLTGPAVQVDSAVTSAAAGYDSGLYLKSDRILRLRAGVKGSLGNAVELAAGVTSVKGGTSGYFMYLQSSSFGTIPTISAQPQSAALLTGALVTLQVAVNGTGPLSYQWFKDGVAVSWARAAQYPIPYATASDAGSYTVTITNSAGSVTSSAAILTVSQPAAPVITTQPSSQTVTVGESVTFAAAASGTPAPTFQWKKNGSAIVGATNASYTIVATAMADAGDYSVVASNSVNSASSTIATLTVSKITATVSLEGLSATYSGAPHPATATTTPAALTVTFTYDGSATAPTNAGTYAVAATINETNYQGSATGTLTIAKATPTITWAPPSAISYGTALSGTQLHATASAAGVFSYSPAMGAVLTAGTHTLNATFTPGDIVNYNGVTAQQPLIVNLASGAPLFLTQPTGQSIGIGSSVTFTATASGAPAPAYQWQKDGVTISGATSSSFTISRVAATDGGNFTLVATNSAGTATSNVANLATFVAPPSDVVISFSVE